MEKDLREEVICFFASLLLCVFSTFLKFEVLIMMISLVQLVVLVLVVAVGFLGAKWLFQKDTVVENYRRSAGKLAAVLTSYGLVKIPDFLIDFSVGDVSGMAEKIKQLAQMFLAGEDAVVKEFDQVFERVLVQKLRTEAGRALIAAKLQDAVLPSDPNAVLNAPVAAVV